MSEFSPCGRFEKEGLLKLEAGEPLDPHFATCPDCLRARAKYKRLAHILSLATRMESPPVGWEARLLARIDGADHRSAAALGHGWIGGRYRITRRIGEGAMGVVFAAVDMLTSHEVAVKVIHACSRDLSHRLLREAKAWGSLSHPNIVKLLDLGEAEMGNPFLVMPLLKGATLAELLRRVTRLDVRVAALIARDVARALAAAHAAGILHRDLNPRSIFLHRGPDPMGVGVIMEVKVLDFGVNRNMLVQEGMLTTTGSLIRSSAYMSPEQVMGCTLGPHSDIWSLGVVLFEMLNGRLPSQDKSIIMDLMVPKMTLTLNSLIKHCLLVDHDHQMGSAKELAEVLNAYMVLPSLEGTKIEKIEWKDAIRASSSLSASRAEVMDLSPLLLQIDKPMSEANDQWGRRSADRDVPSEPHDGVQSAKKWVICGWIAVILTMVVIVGYVLLRSRSGSGLLDDLPTTPHAIPYVASTATVSTP